MAITAVGYGAQTVENTGTTISPSLPAGVTTNDLLILCHTAAGNRTVTIDGTYTEFANQYNATANMRMVTGWKLAGSSEGNPTSTINAASSGWSAQVAAYRGVNQTTPIDVTSVSSELTSTSATWTPTGITTATNDAWVVSIVETGQGIAVNSLGLSVAQSFTLRMGGDAYDYVLAQDMSFGLADREVASFGAVTCPTWTSTVGANNYWLGITVALRPAATAVTPGVTIDFSTDTITYIGGTGGGT